MLPLWLFEENWDLQPLIWVYHSSEGRYGIVSEGFDFRGLFPPLQQCFFFFFCKTAVTLTVKPWRKKCIPVSGLADGQLWSECTTMGERSTHACCILFLCDIELGINYILQVRQIDQQWHSIFPFLKVILNDWYHFIFTMSAEWWMLHHE